MKPILEYEGLYSITESGDVINAQGKTLAYVVNKQTGYKTVSLWKNNKGSSKTIHRLVATAFIPNPTNLPEVNHIDGNKLNNHVSNLEWITPSGNRQHAYDTGLRVATKLLDDPTYRSLLNRFLSGESMTDLAEEHSAGLTRITINLRTLAERLDKSKLFDAQLKEQKRIRNTNSNANKKQQVAQYDLDGVLIKVHESITSATKLLGKSSTGPISNAVRGVSKSAYGFRWELVNTALNDYRKDKVQA